MFEEALNQRLVLVFSGKQRLARSVVFVPGSLVLVIQEELYTG